MDSRKANVNKTKKVIFDKDYIHVTDDRGINHLIKRHSIRCLSDTHDNGVCFVSIIGCQEPLRLGEDFETVKAKLTGYLV